ncbi:MAG: GTP 3',8-cyclase MoaA [Peptoniphilus sp.]|uniref:GTP 3',8-cyclase MoaA n=1 Tax=Peptoniphilus sp. TaxID=1971214 RepID=UPI00260116AC|nr:GTP 3',8-cyclase MoaA [Peptoniphilus sp.]MCI5644076.1 GTP 3',8-cyclase MoaA [Peptoniphilus sp.]MDD7353118.1 GTP 3',8-cyclase MoaA [Peptoniphilaceae bacterium]MDY3902694.1 GTP 3',8-cyclase MoaA [Peptoniphilus sp.]
MRDRFGREIDYIRISLTDRCNLRCKYCMPEEGVKLLNHKDILSYEEILILSKIFISLGIKNFKLTGGEPLVRRDVCNLVKELKKLEGIGEVTITTNGVLLEKYGKNLIDSGIDRINVSLDSLNPIKYEEITGRNFLNKVLGGIKVLLAENFERLKINTVPMKPLDREDIENLIYLGKDNPIDIRFIKIMPMGIANSELGYSKKELLQIIESILGKSSPIGEKKGNGPAEYYSFQNYRSNIGFIDAIDNKFCSECNRIRLSATGFIKLCLYYDLGENIRPYIYSLSENELREKIKNIIYNKPLMHHMNESLIQRDKKNMNQIGG